MRRPTTTSSTAQSFTRTLAGAIALAAFAGASIGAERRCEWVNPPQKQTTCGGWTLVEEGNLWNTYERTCTDTYSGPAIWFTTILVRSCTGSGGIKIGGGTEIEAGLSYTWQEQLVGEPEQGQGSATTTRTERTCPWAWDGAPANNDASQRTLTDFSAFASEATMRAGGPPLDFFPTMFQHETIVNNFALADVFFDGVPVPYLGSVELNDRAPGPHLYTVFHHGPEMAPPLNFHIDLAPSWTLEQIEEFRSVAPMTRVRFTNNSPDVVHAFFTATPQQEGLITFITDNEIDVLPGDSYEVMVQHYTDDGYIATDCQELRSLVEVRQGSQFQPVIATLETTASAGILGDVTGDGSVDFSDLNGLLAQFGQSGVGLSADIDGSGSVGFSDLNVVLTRFGQSCI